jgi:hypothetical protein
VLAFCSIVGIGTPHTQARLEGSEWGDPITKKGQTLWYSVYTIMITLRVECTVTTCPVFGRMGALGKARGPGEEGGGMKDKTK